MLVKSYFDFKIYVKKGGVYEATTIKCPHKRPGQSCVNCDILFVINGNCYCSKSFKVLNREEKLKRLLG